MTVRKSKISSEAAAEQTVRRAERALAHWMRTSAPDERAGMIVTFNMLNAIARDFPTLGARVQAIVERFSSRVGLCIAPWLPFAFELPI